MSGVTLDTERAEILPAGTKLRLLRDRILVRPLEWQPSKIIHVIRHGRALRGVVEAVGPGRYYRRYRPHPTDRNKRQFTETATFIPVQVKPGDVVELGGLNAFDGLGYNFPQVVIGTELFIMAQEQDVAFVDESGCLGPHADVQFTHEEMRDSMAEYAKVLLDADAQSVCAPAASQEIAGSTPARVRPN